MKMKKLVLPIAATVLLAGTSAIGRHYTKQIADQQCAMDKNSGLASAEPDVLYSHADVRQYLHNSSIPIYYLSLPGIEMGISEHNREYHSHSQAVSRD